jgi:hypothetical protein
LGDRGSEGKILLKLNSGKQDVRAWTELQWFGLTSNGGLLLLWQWAFSCLPAGTFCTRWAPVIFFTGESVIESVKTATCSQCVVNYTDSTRWWPQRRCPQSWISPYSWTSVSVFIATNHPTRSHNHANRWLPQVLPPRSPTSMSADHGRLTNPSDVARGIHTNTGKSLKICPEAEE